MWPPLTQVGLGRSKYCILDFCWQVYFSSLRCARPYNTCIVKVKVSLLLYNFIDKGNTELLSSLLSLLVALSTPTSFSRYNTRSNYIYIIILDHAYFVFFGGGVGWGGGEVS
jgi:hypothetical protein